MKSSTAAVFAFLAAVVAPPAVADEQELATYPRTVHTRIGNDLVINGEYYRMAYFTTKDPMDVVAKYFITVWKAEGYLTNQSGDGEEEAVVSAFYTREGLQRSIVLRTHQGKTVGFSILKDLWLEAPRKDPPGLVKLEGTMMSQDVSSRDTLNSSVARTALVQQGLSSARIEALSKYEKDGFTLKRELGQVMDGKQQFVLEFLRGPEEVVVHLGAVEEGLTAMTTTASFSNARDNAPSETARDAMRAPDTARREKKDRGGKK